MSNKIPVLYIIVPCYNEETVLPLTIPDFIQVLNNMIDDELVDDKSRIVFINDGSTDDTWNIIACNAKANEHIAGISLSRNRGHQNALLAGLLESRDYCDITISIDCDGQDDISVIQEMVRQYNLGNEIVYGVRNNRDSDSFFKRFTAQSYYKLLAWMGSEVVYNHADYRLISSKVLNELASYEEVNLYLRGLIPLLGFTSTTVEYKRTERTAGKSHYPLSKMIGLAYNGITNSSVKPLRIITRTGVLVAFFSFIGAIWAIVELLIGNTVPGWASTTCILCFVSGIQIISLGIIGEYIGKIYMETKHRPRYIISKKVGCLIEREKEDG